MYEYTWHQWLTLSFIYCFFGRIFESTHASARTGRFVNRGLLHLPPFPPYGTGVVMMLQVSLPVEDNLLPVYPTGVIAATLLEYVTGRGMERLFRMGCWDYSSQRFSVKGYICPSSSIARGFLTIFLTEAVHRPIEYYVLGLPVMVSIVFVLIATLLFAVDTAESIKAALGLAKMLGAMTGIRAEPDDVQVQMALLKVETSERVAEAGEEAAARLSRMKLGVANHAAAFKNDTAERLSELVKSTMEKVSGFVEGTVEKTDDLIEDTAKKVARVTGRLSEPTEDATARMSGTLARRVEGTQQAMQRDGFNKGIVQECRDKLAAPSQRLASTSGECHMLSSRMDFYRRSILKGNPTASFSRFAKALKEPREAADKRDPDERHIK